MMPAPQLPPQALFYITEPTEQFYVPCKPIPTLLSLVSELDYSPDLGGRFFEDYSVEYGPPQSLRPLHCQQPTFSMADTVIETEEVSYTVSPRHSDQLKESEGFEIKEGALESEAERPANQTEAGTAREVLFSEQVINHES